MHLLSIINIYKLRKFLVTLVNATLEYMCMLGAYGTPRPSSCAKSAITESHDPAIKKWQEDKSVHSITGRSLRIEAMHVIKLLVSHNSKAVSTQS
jgi:hypothetical protein